MKSTLGKRLSLAAKAEAALQDAADRTVARARINRRPLVVWRNGRVVRLSASRVPGRVEALGVWNQKTRRRSRQTARGCEEKGYSNPRIFGRHWLMRPVTLTIRFW